MEVPQMQSWDEWKNFLSKNVNTAKDAGTSQQAIVQAATRIGEFLAENVNPANREQRALAEIWKVASHEEKQVIASCITKMVSDGTTH